MPTSAWMPLRLAPGPFVPLTNTNLLSYVSKMPGASFSLPSRTTCPNGSKLVTEENSVCHHCYAAKGFYFMPGVKDLQAERLAFTKTDDFVPTMVTLLEREVRLGRPYFRFHDSGDVYNADYWKKIIAIVEATPQINHRLPTKETELMLETLDTWKHLTNLTVSVSGYYVNETPAPLPAPIVQSMVVDDLEIAHQAGAFICPATTERKECGTCRACWDRDTPLVAYKKH